MAQSRQVSLGQPRWVWSRAITHADNGTTVEAVSVPANTFIPPYGVCLYVAETFVGGTPSFTVGDSDTDGWLASAQIAEATVGTYCGVSEAYAVTGKHYTSADTIDVIVADTTLTNGTAYLVVQMVDFSGLDLAAS